MHAFGGLRHEIAEACVFSEAGGLTSLIVCFLEALVTFPRPAAVPETVPEAVTDSRGLQQGL